MVPSSNSGDLARRLPNAELAIYPDAGHGGIFQYHQQFVPAALEFLAREQNGASASSSGRVEAAEAS
jgi:pimeloyl-ACP methyl ester carboxylesterase